MSSSSEASSETSSETKSSVKSPKSTKSNEGVKTTKSTSGTKSPRRRRSKPKPKRVDWSSVDWSLSNADIARNVGLSRERVRQVREEMGLEASPSVTRTKLEAEWRERLLEAGVETAHFAEVVRRLGVEETTARKWMKRLGMESPSLYMDWDNEERLGKMSDVELAILLGVAQNTVCQARTRRGIPPFEGPRRKYVKWNPELNALLGTMTDGKVAQATGASHLNVFMRRKKLGIAAYRK